MSVTNPFNQADADDDPTEEARKIEESLRAGEVAVDLDDDPETEDELSREEKKQARKEAWKKGEELQASLESERQRREALEREMQELRQQAQQTQGFLAQQMQRNTPSQAQVALDEARREMQANYDNWQAKAADATPEERQAFEKRAYDLQEKELDARLAQRGIGPSQRMTPEQLAEMQMQTEFPDVMSNPVQFQHAKAAYMRSTSEGKEGGVHLAREVLERTRKDFGRGEKPKPGDADRARYSGQSRRSGSGGTVKKTVTMGKEQRKMAIARWPELDESAAYKKWAKEIGSRQDA